MFANRTNNQHLANQIQMVLNSYNNEFKKRMDELYKKQNIDKQNINKQNVDTTKRRQTKRPCRKHDACST